MPSSNREKNRQDWKEKEKKREKEWKWTAQMVHFPPTLYTQIYKNFKTDHLDRYVSYFNLNPFKWFKFAE